VLRASRGSKLAASSSDFRNMDLNLKRLLAIYGIFILMPEMLMGSKNVCIVCLILVGCDFEGQKM
jgi:hypothetical protein